MIQYTILPSSTILQKVLDNYDGSTTNEIAFEYEKQIALTSRWIHTDGFHFGVPFDEFESGVVHAPVRVEYNDIMVDTLVDDFYADDNAAEQTYKFKIK